MGYIALLVVAVILIPVLMMLFARRPASGREAPQPDNGVTHAQPSSDQPTPRSGTVNRIDPAARKKMPPG
jgi:hypothetical protein